MKKILIINGSPRGGKSNTMHLARAFCEGYGSPGSVIQELCIKDLDINPCTGCFGCWTKTPGLCIFKDDMPACLEQLKEADGVIWAFPLYYFGMPSGIKAFMDRMLPFNEPYITLGEDGLYDHPGRIDISCQDHILISTCGFPLKEKNYEALSRQFEIFQERHTSGGKGLQILCPQGSLFSVPALKGRTTAYLNIVRQAGREFAADRDISRATRDGLDALLFPEDQYIKMANNSWDIPEGKVPPGGDSTASGAKGKAARFVAQMAAVYNPSFFDGDKVIELFFTDLNEGYQLSLGKEGCRVSDGSTGEYTTRIETSFPVWRDISDGKINGAQAMMDGLYKVQGDFNTMIRMDRYFGVEEEDPVPSRDGNKKSNMNLLLWPWISLWILLPMAPLSRWAGIAAVTMGALATLGGLFFSLTPYDRISAALVPLFGLAALLGYNSPFLVCLSYLVFGLMWTLSGRLRVPLTAYYSKNSNGGDRALENPLFIKTNRIITDGWGFLYMLVSLIAWFLLHSGLKAYTGMILQAAPLLMGLFTSWFQKWYPPRVARGA